MSKAKIVQAPASERGYFVTTTKNTSASQRKKLEEVMINLASSLKIKLIYKQRGSQGSYFYEVQDSGSSGFQSALNTILDLSRKLTDAKVDGKPH